MESKNIYKGSMELASYIISLDYVISPDKIFSLREIYEAIVRYYTYRVIERSDSSYEYDEVTDRHRYVFSIHTKIGPMMISERIKMKILKHFRLEDYIGMKLVSRSPLLYMVNVKELPESTLLYKPWGVLSKDIDRVKIKRLAGEIENLERNYYILERTELAERIAIETKARHDVFMSKYLVIKRERLHDFMKMLSDETVQ